jgi:hypothetical protein
MQAVERERNPVCRQHLEMRELRHAVRRKRIGQRTDHRETVAAREFETQQMRGDRRQEEREQKGHVVGDEHAARRRDDRSRDDREAQEMLRKRHHSRDGIELWQAPPARAEGDNAGVPGEEEHVQQRIAEIVRHAAAHVHGQRPGQRDREEEVQSGGEAERSERSAHRDTRIVTFYDNV